MTENHEKSKNGDEIEIFKKNRKSLKKKARIFIRAFPIDFRRN